MIPLSRWLQDRSGTTMTLVSEMEPLPEIQECQGDEPEAQVLLETGTQGHDHEVEELNRALKHAERMLEELSRHQAEKERLLLNELGEEMRSRLASGIDRSFREVLRMIEDSVCQTLIPFLSDEARTRASSELIELIREELKSADSPVMEIRVPAELHEAIEALPECAGVSVAVAASHVAEVVLTARHARFEQLASRWCAAISGASG